MASSSTAGVLADALLGLPLPVFTSAATAFSTVIANSDIVMPLNSSVRTSREVMSHEYGHYLFCSLLASHDQVAVTSLITSTILTDPLGKAGPLRALNEAMADLFTGQVVGAADYGWLDPLFLPNKFCINNGTPCFDDNQFAFATTPAGNASIGRIVTMLHDLVDGRSGGFTAHVPGNADLWDQVNSFLGLSAVQYGSKDADLERLMFTGPQFSNVARHLAPAINAGLTHESIYGAVDSAMADTGATWCDRCRLLALHVAGGQGNVQELWETCQSNPMLANIIGPAPEASLRMSAFDDPSLGISTCQTCPFGFFSDADGQCVRCSGDEVVDNTCQQCSPDIVIDGATSPLDHLRVSTLTSVSGDTCPGTFVLQIKNTQNFFARSVEDVFASVEPDIFANCVQTYNLTTEWLVPTGTLTNTQSSLGVAEPCNEDICPAGDQCLGVFVGFNAATTLSDTVRFVTPASPTTTFDLNFLFEAPIIR